MASSPALPLATFNLLATGYTKFSTVHHSGPAAPPRTLESASQRDARRDASVALIRDLNLEFLLTQEHDTGFDLPRDLFPHVASALALDRTEGCRVYSRTQPFVATAGLEIGDGKTAVVATTADGVTLVSTHLKGGPDSGPVQRAQISRILEAVPPSGPCIIGGDLNATDPDRVFGDLLSAAGFARVPNSAVTGMTSSFHLQLVLDHLYVRGVAAAVRPTGLVPFSPWNTADPPCRTSGSDHIPLVVTLMTS